MSDVRPQVVQQVTAPSIGQIAAGVFFGLLAWSFFVAVGLFALASITGSLLSS